MTAVEDRARTIFLAALERTRDQLPAFLDEACSDDTEVRARVDQLLFAHDALGSIHIGGAPAETTDLPPVTEVPGAMIGPYKLVQQIGEGGMGAVWMAQQTEPVKRLVAVKLIKAGMDSRQVIARFEAERQALALMDHPNIAKVLDAGTTDAGRPYFVMDLVKGVPITKYCDEHHLTPRQRLELFIPVCQAVQHAHQKGIIHRDLKPSNVLVALYDGKPVPKVIDFGIAKAAGQQLTEKTLVTGFGAIVGTLEYMSPEQAEINQLDIDTRSDVYSLGVLLYELLAGNPPFTCGKSEKGGMLEMLRMIREQEPTKPSTKLSTAEGLPALAANRGTEPVKLTKLVRGELDWIVLKALEKDRNRRYETANGFAMDVQRYLADEPVLAGPPSVAYRVRKFAKRNRGAVLAASLMLVVLVGGIVGTTLGLIDARQGRAAAERSELKALAAAAAEEKAKVAAEESDAESRAVLDFVERTIFAAMRSDNYGGLGRQVTLRRAIEEALPFVENSFKNQPLTEARLRFTIGQSFRLLGEIEATKRAADQFQAARTLYAAHRGADHLDTIWCMFNMAQMYATLGRGAEAAKLYEETLPVFRAKLGPDHPSTLLNMDELAAAYGAVGRYAEAMKLEEVALAIQSVKLGRDHPETLKRMDKLAGVYTGAGQHLDALKLCTELLEIHRAKDGPNHDATASSMYDLANTYTRLGRHAEGLVLLDEWVALMRAKTGPGWWAGGARIEYFAAIRQQGALKLRDDIVALRKARDGPDHPSAALLASLGTLADVCSGHGLHPEAIQISEELVELHKAKFGPDAPATFLVMDNLAYLYRSARRRPEAVKVLEQKVGDPHSQARPGPPGHPPQQKYARRLLLRRRSAHRCVEGSPGDAGAAPEQARLRPSRHARQRVNCCPFPGQAQARRGGPAADRRVPQARSPHRHRSEDHSTRDGQSAGAL